MVDTTDGEDTTGPSDGWIQLTVNRDVDVLFVVDNSGSMGEEQGRLAADMQALLDVLDGPDVAANWRIGVTTTDNGNPWCGSTTPEGGSLQLSSCRERAGEFVFNGNPPADATATACTDICNADTIDVLPTTTEYDPTPTPRPWVERIAGASNVGDLDPADALRCAIPQGIAGCGFESHLESMHKALVRAQSDAEAQYGFLRTNAVLSVVIVTDEVDCSHAPEYESIFLDASEGGNQVFWSDPGASAPTSAVCWNAGVVCEGSGTPYDSCRASNKDIDGNIDVSDADAVLQPISRYADLLQEIELTKQQITPNQEVLVSLIGGVPQGGDVVYSNALDPSEQNDFGIGPGCVYDDGDPMTPPAAARPPVREREVVEAFEIGESRLYSICQESYAEVLAAVGDAIADQLVPACMPACVADVDPVNAGVQTSCTVRQEAPAPGGVIEEVTVPPCDGDAVPADADVCWVALTGDAMSDFCSEFGWNLEVRIVRRDGVPAPGGAAVSANCELSNNKAIDCPLLP